MLFKVKNKITGDIYDVYHVSRTKTGFDAWFLVYRSDAWTYMSANFFEPYKPGENNI